MVRKFQYHGKTIEELKKMTIEEFANLLNARQRRSLKRGLTKQQKKLLENIRRFKGEDKLIKTQCRDMIVTPEMVDAKLGVHDGKEYKVIVIIPEMIGHYLGEFVLTRVRVMHSAPGLGATRSSKFVPLK